MTDNTPMFDKLLAEVDGGPTIPVAPPPEGLKNFANALRKEMVREETSEEAAETAAGKQVDDDPEEEKFDPLKGAKLELQLAKRDASDAEVYTRIVDYVWYLAHTTEEIAEVLDTVSLLCHTKNLTPLTDSPDEWDRVTPSLHRSTRNNSAFSSDGGRTYWLYEERMSNNTFPIHQTLHKEPSASEPTE